MVNCWPKRRSNYVGGSWASHPILRWSLKRQNLALHGTLACSWKAMESGSKWSCEDTDKLKRLVNSKRNEHERDLLVPETQRDETQQSYWWTERVILCSTFLTLGLVRTGYNCSPYHLCNRQGISPFSKQAGTGPVSQHQVVSHWNRLFGQGWFSK
jgi:hypothetical protein